MEKNIHLTKNEEHNRNNYIDLLKGIAIISVVFIHTAFASGAYYVPRWFANFTLLFEVPMFFFLSGWSFSYSKSSRNYLKSLILTQIRYMIFIFIMAIIIDIINYINIGKCTIGLLEFVKWIFHGEISTEPLISIYHSLWFFRVYFIVCIIGAIILKLFNDKFSKYITIICGLIIFVTTFIAQSLGNIDIGMGLNYTVFYLFFYLLGYITKNKTLKLLKMIIIFTVLICCLIGIHLFTEINLLDIQTNKFPPNFIFLGLRYPFGGDRPSQTPRLTLSPARVTGAG